MSDALSCTPNYVDYLKGLSHLATLNDDYSALELAAHVFAVAQQLVDDDHDLGRLPFHPGFDSLSDLEAGIRALPDNVTAVDLYRFLTVALTTIESECSDADEGYFHSVTLEELKIGEEVRLGGRVIYWLRGHRLYRTLRDGGFDEARRAETKLPPKRREHPGRHLDRLFCFWAREHRIPEIVRAEPVDPQAFLVTRGSMGIAAGESFRVALCPLVGEAKPQFVLTADADRFRTSQRRPMVAPEGQTVRDQLEVLLRLADRESIDVLILPELMIDPGTRSWLEQRLAKSGSHRPSGVIAGSFHFDRRDRSRPRNESLFLDESGRRLLAHHKRGCFSISKAQAESCLDAGLFENEEATRAALETLPPGIDIEEYIAPGRRIELFESALGQIAVLICADAIDPTRREMLEAVIRLRPDFVIVPSMSFETLRFERFADDMERFGISTLFVNAHCVCPPGEVLATVCLDLFRGKGGPATRARWRRGYPRLEEWRRGRRPDPDPPADEPAASESEKARLPPEPKPAGHWRDFESTGTSFRLLHGSDQTPLGLVLDLGAFWRPEDEDAEGLPAELH